MNATMQVILAEDKAEAIDGWNFSNDCDAVLEALNAYDKLSGRSFMAVSAKSFAQQAGIPYSKVPGRLLAALQYQMDDDFIQFSYASSSTKGDTLYLRAIVEKPDTELDVLTTSLCQPMTATDVLAICAMVTGGMRGVHKLTGHPKSKLETWRQRGISTKREDARQTLLNDILRHHLKVRDKLIDEPLQIERWVESQAEVRADRMKRYSNLLKLAYEYTPPPAPEPKPEPKKDVVTTKTAAARICGLCNTAKLKGDEMLCRACSIKLMKQSGHGPLVIAEPMNAPDWRSDVEKEVAQHGAELGLARETYCAIAGGIHQAQAAIEEIQRQGNSIDLSTIGVYVKGVNLDQLKVDEAEPADDVETEKGRKGYVRVLGRWVISPTRLQDSVQKLQSKLTAIAGPLQTLLVDLQDVEGGADLRKAIGSHGAAQDLMEAGSLTYMLQYLVNDLVGQLTPDTSQDG